MAQAGRDLFSAFKAAVFTKKENPGRDGRIAKAAAAIIGCEDLAAVRAASKLATNNNCGKVADALCAEILKRNGARVNMKYFDFTIDVELPEKSAADDDTTVTVPVLRRRASLNRLPHRPGQQSRRPAPTFFG